MRITSSVKHYHEDREPSRANHRRRTPRAHDARGVAKTAWLSRGYSIHGLPRTVIRSNLSTLVLLDLQLPTQTDWGRSIRSNRSSQTRSLARRRTTCCTMRSSRSNATLTILSAAYALEVLSLVEKALKNSSSCETKGLERERQEQLGQRLEWRKRTTLISRAARARN